MYRLESDIPFSRRKRMQAIFDENGHIAWTGKTVTGALQWLYDNGHDEFLWLGGEHAWKILMVPALKPQ